MSNIRYKLGFLLLGLLNNYNFIVIFSCAYAMSASHSYINPSLLILTEIIPGFITQLLYPIFLIKISYTYRFIFLFLLQISSSLSLIVSQESNLALIFSGIIFVSINSYLGESSILSLSSFYERSEMKFWSIGTGLAGMLGTGVFLLLNQVIDPKIIFALNLVLYLIFYSVGLYLLEYRTRIVEKTKEATTSQDENPVPLEEFDLSSNEIQIAIPATFQSKFQKIKTLFLNSSSLIVAYFLAYFVGFCYVPLLSSSNFEYQVLQFITRTAFFFGRFTGNYIPFVNQIKEKHIRLGTLFHLYTFFILLVYTGFIVAKIQVPIGIIYLSFILSYLFIGISYPMVYNFIYTNYESEKEWYMGSVGQFTSFFTILGCTLGYPLFMLLK